ncbi:hypothetical protein V6N13_034105 [Hibiscus sabdariffa]
MRPGREINLFQGHPCGKASNRRCPEIMPPEGPGHEGNASHTTVEQPQYKVQAKEAARAQGADTPRANKAKVASRGAPSAAASSPRTLPSARPGREGCSFDQSARMAATTELKAGH